MTRFQRFVTALLIAEIIGCSGTADRIAGNGEPRSTAHAAIGEPIGRYALTDSTIGSRSFVAAGEINFQSDSSYVWTMGTSKKAGRWFGTASHFVMYDSLWVGGVGVWTGAVTSGTLSVRLVVTDSLVYHFNKTP